MTKRIKVGDLVISRAKNLARWIPSMVGRPALVIDTGIANTVVFLRLKVGEVEWWDEPDDCEKVSE